jgi:hypothetical protein
LAGNLEGKITLRKPGHRREAMKTDLLKVVPDMKNTL